MKILILTQWFEPEPAFKGLLFAKALTARGHEVEVLTGFPNYPDGKIYPGYKIRLWRRECADGIPILRVALYPSHNNSSVGRLLNYLSFALSAAVIGSVLVRKPDVIYVYHPPLTSGIAAAVISVVRGAPFVFDIQDLWPDAVAASGMMTQAAALKALERLCKFVYRRARHIIVLSQSMRERLVKRDVSEQKIDVIYNWCDEATMQPCSEPPTRLSEENRFSILFAGTMGRVQGLDSVLRAAEICRQTVPAAEFLFIGGGVDRQRLERLAREMNLNNVRFLPRQPMCAMGAILAGADALLVHLKDDPLIQIAVPSKTQAYLAAGKPIVMAVRGEAAEFVRRSRAGIVCAPDFPEGIADAVKQMVEACRETLLEMGENGKAFYWRELSLDAGVDKFERIFDSVIARSAH